MPTLHHMAFRVLILRGREFRDYALDSALVNRRPKVEILPAGGPDDRLRAALVANSITGESPAES